MPSNAAAIAVLTGPGAIPVHSSSDPATLALLAEAGLDPAQLVTPAAAGTCVRLTQDDGWERLNLGALRAAARARPGVPVEFRTAEDQPPLALAVDGPAAALDGPAEWRFTRAGRPRPTVALLDRDGTIIEDRHYLADAEGVTLLPGAAEGLRALADLGMRLVVVTNQSGVALGRIRPNELASVHARLRTLLLAEGVQLAGIFACTHHPDAGCPCRKPADGLARQAAQHLDLDLERALVAGDKNSDIGLGRRLGVPTFLLSTGEGWQTLQSGAAPADYLVDDLRELARLCAHPAGLGTLQRLGGEGATLHG